MYLKRIKITLKDIKFIIFKCLEWVLSIISFPFLIIGYLIITPADWFHGKALKYKRSNINDYTMF
jgi:hypothetical protein